MPQRTVAVIDGNSLMHRAFHAVDAPMTAPTGEPTNAVFGFLSMFFKMVDEFAPDGVICAFDAGRPKFRMEALGQYKAQRPPMDEGLRVQFPMIEGLLVAMGIPVVKIPEWEGDDILGTYARLGEEGGTRILLVTGDKDSFQLASDTTQIVATKRGITDVVVYGPEQVEERYGVTPAQVPDFLGLKGDSSDNIPGVPGVGEKTAAKLLAEYGTLDNLLEHDAEIKGKLGERLRENEEAARVSRFVATIRRDAPVEVALDDAVWPSFDEGEARRAFGALRFNAHLGKLLGYAVSGDAQEAPAVVDGRVVFGDAEDDAIIAISPVFAGDEAKSAIEGAIAREEWLGVSIACDEEGQLFGTRTLYVACDAGIATFAEDEIGKAIAQIAREGKMVGHDLKQLLQVAAPPDTSRAAQLAPQALDPERLFDTSIAAYLLMSNAKAYPVEGLLLDYMGFKAPGGDDAPASALIEAAGAKALKATLAKELEGQGAHKCFYDIELRLLPVLIEMERTGTALDTKPLKALSAQVASEIEALKGEIYDLAGVEFNIDSPKQLGEVLFERLGLPARKKTQRGYSTDAKVLTSLSKLHPLPAKVLHYRELAKLRSTYLDALPQLLRGDGRLHTSFNQTVTATGRLSSSEPNLQNIPVRTDFGKQVREAFAPAEDDYVFLAADYSQIELRLLAHLSGDEHLVAAFTSGADFHRATAARVFGVSPDDVTPQMRSKAKAVNFGIVYGQQAFGLGQTLHIPMAEAQEMIDRYFEAYPRVRSYLDEVVARARELGYVETIFGRRRHIPELASRNANLRAFGERTAMNHPMQGSAADIIKLAMIEVATLMRERGLEARLVLQVHDELDFECPVSEVESLSELVVDAMSGVVELKVPLVVDVSHGKTWAQAK